jgi:thioredoxin:protein disulfide reductase
MHHSMQHGRNRLARLGDGVGAMLAVGLLSLGAHPSLGATAAPTPAIDQVLHLGQVKSNQGTFLPPDQAFRVFAQAQGPDHIQLVWEIADGYYLYRNRLKVATDAAVKLGELVLPVGQSKTDEYFGTQQIYHDELRASLPVGRAGLTTALTVPVKVTYQGCAEAGLCYPPITKVLSVSLPAPPGSSSVAGPPQAHAASGTLASGAAAAMRAASGAATGRAPVFVSDQDRYASVVRGGSWLGLIAFFYAAGLVLAFTPCVLPMVPIVSGIIVGERNVTAGRGFVLSLTYVLGMALTYTAAGIAVAAGGRQVQAAFQQPWIVATFAALFIVLALSMFGLFTLQMPAGIQTRLSSLSNRQSAGTLGGVLIMGALSALIVTTCVAPALVGALVVIGQSGDLLRGGTALFVMALGMGTPLLVIGASAGKLLPRAGAWMDTVKQLFGALMLAVAVWMLTRIVPERAALLLWAVPVFAAAVVLWGGARALSHGLLPARLAASLAALYGCVLVTGAALGGTDPLAPLPALSAPRHELVFRTIKSVADLDGAVAQARAQSRPVMLDFYADWCVSCKEMQKYTFTDPTVQAALRSAVLLRADVTRNDAADQALLKRFGIYGPPTIAFYGTDGRERRDYRVVGYMKAPEFASVAERAIASRLDAVGSSALDANGQAMVSGRSPLPGGAGAP